MVSKSSYFFSAEEFSADLECVVESHGYLYLSADRVTFTPKVTPSDDVHQNSHILDLQYLEYAVSDTNSLPRVRGARNPCRYYGSPAPTS